jgi:hypothetical protein
MDTIWICIKKNITQITLKNIYQYLHLLRTLYFDSYINNFNECAQCYNNLNSVNIRSVSNRKINTLKLRKLSKLQRPFKWKPEKLYKIHSMKQPVITLLSVTRWSPLATTCGYTKPSDGRSWNYQLLKMAAPLQSCTKRDAICDPISQCRRCQAVEFYTRMLAKYSASSMSKTQGYEWVQKF